MNSDRVGSAVDTQLLRRVVRRCCCLRTAEPRLRVGRKGEEDGERKGEGENKGEEEIKERMDLL